MKKLLTLTIIALMCLFAGCGAPADSEGDAPVSAGKSVQSPDKKETQALQENKEEEKSKDQEDRNKVAEDAGLVEKKWLSYIGASRTDIESDCGAMSENLWADGPLYRFGPDNVWYAFSEYDFGEDNSYVPLGTCTQISVPLAMFLKNTDVYNAEALENAIGAVLSESYSQMDEMYVYSANYMGHTIAVYTYSKADIDESSVVNIGG